MKRLTLFAGHYGSGKTNLAVNFARRMAEQGLPVTLADLDIVNPYFRSADSREELERAGVKLISLPYAGSNVDLPSLPPEAYSLVQDRSRYGVIDLGGDDRGAYALGLYRDAIIEENDYENLMVVNFLRPLTRDPEEALEALKEIEAVSGIPFTGVVNNTNLGAETTPELIIEGRRKAEAFGRLAGLPLRFTSAEEGFLPALRAAGEKELFGMTLQKRPTET